MSEIRNVEVRLTSNERQFVKGFSKAEKQVDRFSKHGVRGMTRLGKSIRGVSGKIGGLIVGFGALSKAKEAIDFEASLMRTKIAGNATTKQMLQLEKDLYRVGLEGSQSPNALLAGVNKIIERTGDWSFAAKSLKPMAIGSTASGADPVDVGAMFADLRSNFGVKAEELFKYTSVMAAQGKHGSFTLQDMVSQMPELLPAFRAADVDTFEEFRRAMAMLQVYQLGTGSPDLTKTAMVRTLSDIIKKDKKIKELLGFEVFEPEKVEGKSVLKPIDHVIKQIIERSRGDQAILGQIFGEQAQKGIKAMAISWGAGTKTRGWSKLDAIAMAGGDGVALMKDFSDYAGTTAAKLGDIETQAQKLTNTLAKEPIEKLNTLLDLANKYPEAAAGTAAGGGALAVLAAKLGLIWPALAATGAGAGGWFAGKALNKPLNKAAVKLSGGKNQTFGGLVHDQMQRYPGGIMPMALTGPGLMITAGKQILNTINLVVNIQRDGKIITESDNLNTNINLPRGRVFEKK